MNGTDTELSFDGGDERRALEECTGESFQCSRESLFGLESGM